MPYIRQEDRWSAKGDPENAGELNYSLTCMIQEYLGREPNYQLFNDVLGALEGCKLELYRRRIAIYENGKIKTNGDVYTEEI